MIGKRFLQFLLSIFLACTVFVQNPAAVRAEGGSFEVVFALQDDHVKAEKDGTARLEVTVNTWDDLDSSDISLQWYKVTENPLGYQKVALEGETSSVLLLNDVKENAIYLCEGTDTYGYTRNVRMYVYPWCSFEANLDVSDTITKYYVGETETIHVDVESEMPVTYSWSRSYAAFDPETHKVIIQNEKIDNNTDTLTLEDINMSQYIYATVHAEDGSYKVLSVNVKIDNAYVISAKKNYSVNYNESVELSVGTSAFRDENASYYWYLCDQKTGEETFIEDSVASTYGSRYTTPPITDPVQYKIIGIDQFRNVAYATIDIEVTRDNHFKAQAIQESYTVHCGDDVLLEVETFGDDLSDVNYTWSQTTFDPDGNGTTQILQEGEIPTYLIENIQKSATINCRVKDKYNNSQYVSFTITIENDFHADADPLFIEVNHGENATLKVNTTGEDLSDVTYIWRWTIYDESGKRLKEETIQNVSGPVFEFENIQHSNEINCFVTDRYGNKETVNFIVTVLPCFSAVAEQSNFVVNPGDRVDLKVIIDSDEIDPSQLEYEWTRYYNGIGGWSGEPFTDENGVTPTGPSASTTVTVSEKIYCSVKSANGDVIDVYFYISVDNHLDVQAEQSTYYLEPGEEATLKVNVTADDMSDLKYYWEDENYHSSSGTDSRKVIYDKPTKYRCWVYDKYQNYEITSFYLAQENHFTANAAKEVINVKPGGTAIAEVLVEGDDLSKARYDWYIQTPFTTCWANTETQFQKRVLELKNIRNDTVIRCTVNDGYGNEKQIVFKINIVIPEYNEPTYTWAEDYSSVTASAVNQNDVSDVITETVKTIATNTIEATCETSGSSTYTAEFENEMFETQTKTVEIPALGHKYGEPTYEWTEDNSSVAAKAVCEHDSSHVITETVKTTVKTVDATCEEAGSTTYTAVFTNELFSEQTKVVEIPALGHDWQNPVWTWAEDYSIASVTFMCAHDAAHTKTIDAVITKETDAASCEESGLVTYTAKAVLEGTEYTDSKEVYVEAVGHDYGEPSYVWSDDNSTVTATAVCKNDASHVITETVKTTVKSVDATCETAGSTTFTATFTNELFSEQTKTVEIPALGHKYGEPTYEWTADNSSVTAKAICEHDAGHVVIETVKTIVETVDATCETAGSTTYTATFTNELFSEQTKTVEIPALGHEYGEPTYEWSEDNSSVTAKAICEHDANHVVAETVLTTSETIPATEDKDGSTTYTAVFTNVLFTTQTKVVVIPATGPQTIHVTGVELNKTELTLRVGKSETLIATVLPEDAEDKSVTWSSSDPSVAKVDANGKVTAVADTGIADPSKAVITATTTDGSYTASCTVMAEDPINAFVRRLYKLCFGRTPDRGGFNTWTTQLRTKTRTAESVVHAFFLSMEMENKNLPDEEWVERCYLVIMDRKADAGGKKYWLSKLEAGMSKSYVIKGLICSTEFKRICDDYGIIVGTIEGVEPRDVNQGITEFVSRCYKEVLGRKGDPDGLNYWCEKIVFVSNKKQAAIDTASHGFFHSAEYLNKHTTNDQYVRTLYRTFLGREADTGGYNYWMNKLKAGTSRDSVLNGFAYSTEFANIMAKYGIK